MAEEELGTARAQDTRAAAGNLRAGKQVPVAQTPAHALVASGLQPVAHSVARERQASRLLCAQRTTRGRVGAFRPRRCLERA